MRFVFVDDVYGQAVKFEHRPHPFRVALRQIRIHRHHMHAAARQRVEVDGQDGHQRLALARLHLGDAPLMQHHSAEQLRVVRHHVPGNAGPPRFPFLAQQAAARFLDHGERLRNHAVERFLERLQPFLFQPIHFLEKRPVLPGRKFRGRLRPDAVPGKGRKRRRIPGRRLLRRRGGGIRQTGAQRFLARLVFRHGFPNARPKIVRAGPQRLVRKVGQVLAGRIDPVDDRPEPLQLPFVLVAEQRLKEFDGACTHK